MSDPTSHHVQLTSRQAGSRSEPRCPPRADHFSLQSNLQSPISSLQSVHVRSLVMPTARHLSSSPARHRPARKPGDRKRHREAPFPALFCFRIWFLLHFFSSLANGRRQGGVRGCTYLPGTKNVSILHFGHVIRACIYLHSTPLFVYTYQVPRYLVRS